MISLGSWVPALRSGVLLNRPKCEKLSNYWTLNVRLGDVAKFREKAQGQWAVEHGFWLLLQGMHNSCFPLNPPCLLIEAL